MDIAGGIAEAIAGDYAWVPGAVISVVSCGISALAYRHARQKDRPVKWDVARVDGRTGTTVVVTNRGIGRARQVQVSFDPQPTSFHDGDPSQPEDVDLGAIRRFAFSSYIGQPSPARVTIRWKSWLGLQRSWSSAL